MAYYRTSTVLGVDHRRNDSQRTEAHGTAKREGWTLPRDDDHEFQDTVSASVFALAKGKTRTGWQDLLDRIARGGVHAVILAEVSRGTREQVAYQQLAHASSSKT